MGAKKGDAGLVSYVKKTDDLKPGMRISGASISGFIVMLGPGIVESVSNITAPNELNVLERANRDLWIEDLREAADTRPHLKQDADEIYPTTIDGLRQAVEGIGGVSGAGQNVGYRHLDRFGGERERDPLRPVSGIRRTSAAGAETVQAKIRVSRRLNELIFELPTDDGCTEVGNAVMFALMRLGQADDLAAIKQIVERERRASELSPTEALYQVDALGFISELDFREFKLSDQDAAVLTRLWQLRRLDLSDTNIDDDQLAGCPSWGALTELNLSGTTVTGTGLKHLKAVPNLSSLELAGTRIRDQDLSLLIDFPALKQLDLSRCAVSDAGVEPLLKLPRLELIKLGGTSMTADGLLRLKNTFIEEGRVVTIVGGD